MKKDPAITQTQQQNAAQHELETLQRRVKELEQLNLSRIQTEETLARERRRLRTLYEISSDQNITLDLQIENTLRLGVETLDMASGIVSHIQGDLYTVMYFYAEKTGLARGKTFDLGVTYCSLTLSADDVVSIDYMRDSDYSGHPCYNNFKLESYIGVPLIVNGERYGTLNFSKALPTAKPFTPSDRDFIRLMGRWVSNVLERQISEEQLNTYRESLEELVEERTNELYKINQHLQQAQKMEALGRLAGGISHDFNNILSAVFGYAQLAIFESGTPKLRTYLDEILKAGKRAKDLVRQILAFSRNSHTPKIPSDIGPVLLEALSLLRASLPAVIEIKHNISKGQPTVSADRSQMHQVMMNLCTNAFHAMKEKGGLLEIKLEPVTLTDDSAGDYQHLTPGIYLQLSVSDTGRGMSADILEHIFEPYFTTKKISEGTGLGLATVHGIISDHGGLITASSVLGVGTTFNILLPVIQQQAEQTKSQIKPPSALGGNERILLVDDEESLVVLGGQLLSKLGYTVVTETDPEQALKLVITNPHAYDLIITDMSMPKMTGRALALQIRQIRDNLPVLLCTGFSHETDTHDPDQTGICGTLLKPLTIQEIAAVGRDTLDRYTTSRTGSS